MGFNIPFFAGGAKPATNIEANVGTFTGGTPARSTLPQLGCSQSASVTSGSLTEVLNISGSGVLTFAAMHMADNGSINNALFRITVDGVIALDDTNIDLIDQDAAACAVGLYASPAGTITVSQEPITFNKSLVIEISGAASANDTQLSYKRYLT